MTKTTNIDDITISYSEDGVDLTQELDKKILSRGAWTTILFKYHEWDKRKQEYGPVKYALRRYQKREGEFLLKSKFTVSSSEQASIIIDTLTDWLKKDKK